MSNWLYSSRPDGYRGWLFIFCLNTKNEKKSQGFAHYLHFLSNVAKLKELTPFKQLSILTLLAWEKLKNNHKAKLKTSSFRPFLIN